MSRAPTLRRAALSTTVWLALTSAVAATPTPPAWALLPQPVAVVQADTGSVAIDEGATVDVRGVDRASMQAVADRFMQRVADVRGLRLRMKKAGDAPASITFDVNPDASVVGDAGYRITVDKRGIVVSARSARGAFHGSVTLWQLLTQAGWTRGSTAHVGYGSIDDHPRFAWRALLLDSSRHYQSVAEIKQLIDLMSLDKLNVVVWHLTDDQGWRLPITKYPELTRIGACREAAGFDSELTGSPEKPYCGFYTSAEIGDIVRYAAERYVEIVPEIDLPGHSQAAIAAYPWLGVTGKRPAVWTDWGVSPWLLKPDARTLQFVDDVLDEVMGLFPSRYISLGGDEADKQQWNASPEVRAQQQALKLANMDELQGWFMQQVASHLTARGRIPVGWDDEVAAGVALPRSQVVMSWHGDHDERVALAAIRQGHDVVMTPQESLYFDHLQSTLPDEWPGPSPADTLKQAYDTDVIPPGASAAEAHHVIGVQAGLWTEQMPTFANDQHALFPRIAALAERGWSAADVHDWQRFLTRLYPELSRYRALGIDAADTAFAPAFEVTSAGTDGYRVVLSNQVGDGEIHYTTDGSPPDRRSTTYAHPLMLPAGTRLQAVTFAPDGTLIATTRSHTLDTATSLTRDGSALGTCSGQMPSRLQGARQAQDNSPVYSVDIGHACWLWPQARLDGLAHVALTVERLPWRFGDEARDAEVRHRAGGDAVEIHVDRCDGPLLAALPLEGSAQARGQIHLEGSLPTPAMQGTHALCVVATGDPRQGQWALGSMTFSQ